MPVPSIGVPPGTKHVVGLLLTDPSVGDPSFQPGSIGAASSSTFSSGLPVYPTILEGPGTLGSVTRFIAGVNNSESQNIAFAGAGNGIGMLMVAAANYAYDPSFTEFTNRILRRGTGGNLDVANPLYAEGAATSDTGDRAGQDVRSFLYARDADDVLQAVRLQATAAGALNVNTGPIAPTITTVDDVSMVVATNTLLAAANLNRVQLIIQNVSGTPTDINRVGDTNITGGRGIQIIPGQTLILDTTAAVFGRPESGNGPMTVTEIEA